jgi:ABC-type uncharacterized transport system permease subunit
VVFPIVIGALFSPLIYFSIKLFILSIAFYFRRSIALMSGVYNMKELGKYPSSIYRNGSFLGEVIYNILVFIIPFGLVGYLPLVAQMFHQEAISLLGVSIPSNNYLIMGIIIIVALAQFLVAYGFFIHSLHHYNSAGS